MGATAQFVGSIASMAGTGVKAFGQSSAGTQQRNLYTYNAQVADLQAQDALARGDVLAGRRRLQTEQVIGEDRASLGAQGVDVNKGSAVDVQADARYLGELDAMTIKNNAAREAWGYQVQAQDYRTRAALAYRTGAFGAAGTLLTGASDLLLKKFGLGGDKEAPGTPYSAAFAQANNLPMPTIPMEG